MSTITQKMFLRFPKSETEKPVVYHLVRDYGLEINIFRAQVNADDEGYLAIDVTGDEEKFVEAMEFLRSLGVLIDPINKGVRWDEAKCVHCTNCTVHCPTGALSVKDRKTMTMQFTENLCVECLNCLTNCPYGACTSAF